MQQEVGIRLKVAAQGLEQIQALIKELEAAGVNTGELKQRASALGASLDQLNQSAGTAPKSLGGLKEAAAQTAEQFAVLYAKVKGAEAVLRELVNAVVDLDRLRRTLTVVTGSSDEAARQIEFLRSTAMRTGQSFDALAGEYGKFVASASAAGVPLGVVQQTFQGVAAAAGTLGLSGERVSLILNALGQMAAKGTVQMEELRGQLGESLPGALALMAKGLGLSEQQLIKLVESGGLLARDALPAIGQAMTEFAAKGGGEVKGITADWNRFKNVMLEAGVAIAEGPLGQAVGVVLVALAGVLRDIAFVGVSASQAIGAVGKTIGLVVAALTGQIGSFRQFRDELDQIMIDAGNGITRFRDRAYGASDGAKAAGSSAAAAAPQVSALGQSMSAASGQAAASAAAHAQAATSVAAAGTAAGGATTQWYAIKVAYDQVLDSVGKQVQLSDQLLKSKEAEGKAAVSSAKLIGDERIALEAQAKAAEESASAYEQAANAQQIRVDVLRAERNALVETSKAEGGLSEDRKKQIADIDDLIEKDGALATTTRRVAEEHRQLAIAARQSAQTFGDNAYEVPRLRAELRAAEAELERVRLGMVAGVATTQDLERATTEYRAALGRLRDGVVDAESALANWIKTRDAETQVAVARLKLQLAEQKAIEEIALLHGNEVQAIQAKIKQKEIELEITRLTAKAKSDEADETIRVIKQEAAELAQLGLLTPEKKREIDLRLRNAEAMKLESQAQQQGTRVAEEQLRNLQTGGAPGSTPPKSSADQGPPKQNNARPVGIGPDGTYAGISGITNTWESSPGNPALPQAPVDNSYVFKLRERYLAGGTFAASERQAIENALQVAKDNARLIGSSTPQSIAGLRDAENWVTTLQSILERTPSTSSSTPASASSRVVTINIGSSSRNINVASDADANALEQVMRDLEAQARVAQPGG